VSFAQAVLHRDFAKACEFVATTAPPKESGAGACPSRLGRATNVRVVGIELRDTDLGIDVDGHENGRVYIGAYERGGFLDTTPVLHFIFVREDGALRIEHIDGSF
jgi:hypothetical protein